MGFISCDAPTAPADLFVISPRWLAEQHLLTAVSYRLGFIDAAQAVAAPNLWRWP